MVGVGGEDALQEEAGVRVAGHDGGSAVRCGESLVAEVKTQAGLAGVLVWSVAGVAVARQDRLHVVPKVDLSFARARDGGQEPSREGKGLGASGRG